jgi:hypothetical protein
MKHLIDGGADLSVPDEWGRTVLMYAASRGDVVAVTMLLEANATVDQRDLVTLLTFSSLLTILVQ